MDELSKIIEQCIAEKEGDKEFALFFFPNDSSGEEWHAKIGNTCAIVMLGETEGEFSAGGTTAVGAVAGLLTEIRKANAGG